MNKYWSVQLYPQISTMPHYKNINCFWINIWLKYSALWQQTLFCLRYPVLRGKYQALSVRPTFNFSASVEKQNFSRTLWFYIKLEGKLLNHSGGLSIRKRSKAWIGTSYFGYVLRYYDEYELELHKKVRLRTVSGFNAISIVTLAIIQTSKMSCFRWVCSVVQEYLFRMTKHFIKSDRSKKYLLT